MPSTSKVVLALLAALLGFSLLSLRGLSPSPAQVVQQSLLRQTDSLSQAVQVLQTAVSEKADTALLQQLFRELRLAYKKLEWAVEYFDPLTTRQVNGPPVPEVELNGQLIIPNGLQVIENGLFSHPAADQQAELPGLLERLAANVREFRAHFRQAELQDWQILDAVKLEVFRIETLGLNDFDDPLLGNCFAESAEALQSIRQVTRLYGRVAGFGPAIRYLQQPVDFDHFDRAVFIIHYADSLSRGLTRLKTQLHLPDVRYNRLLNQDAATLFEPGAYNRNAYTAAPEDSATTAKIILGKRLFFDPLLSGSGTRSCASCHQPSKAFTDGLVKNLDITGKKMIARNTPTLINAALQPAQFYDSRALSLEDQARDVMQNKDEMHGDMQASVGRLWQDSSYRELFSEAYPQPHRMAIDTFEVMNALAAYVRGLSALNSRFDQYMRGDPQAMRKDEVSGFNLFMGKAKCSTCHYLPLFNGALPPRYMQLESEVIGVPQMPGGRRIDPDPGVYAVQPFAFNRHAFKITSVRNAARTPPYMHNGVFKTLEEVIDFYDKGGGAGNGLNVPNQTLPADQLHLTVAEKQRLIAFIKALDSH